MMKYVVDMFEELGVFFDVCIVFVYWILECMYEFVKFVKSVGFKVIIVGVGGVVYLFGMIVVFILLLVFGVFVESCVLLGEDSLLFIV